MNPRPWRLTRRQRVEMEALRRGVAFALTHVRYDVWNGRRPDEREHRLLSDALDALGGCGYGRFADPDDTWWEMEIGEEWRQWRLVAVRVAIALRAALRADEDARCEEALARAGHGEETGATPGDGWDVGYDEGAESAVDAMRTWPRLDRGWSWTVPLALWERGR